MDQEDNFSENEDYETKELIEKDFKVSATAWESKINLYTPSFFPIADLTESEAIQESVSQEVISEFLDGKVKNISTINLYRPSLIGIHSSEKAPDIFSSDSLDECFYQEECEKKQSKPKRTLASASTMLGLMEIEEKLKEDEEFGLNGKREVREPSESSESDSEFEWPEEEFPGSWGYHGLEEIAWNDEDKPYIRLREYEDITLGEYEKNGVLTDLMMATCSSYLDRCPETGKYVLCKLKVPGKNLRDISLIAYHHYLQHVNLSNNQLEDLKPLGQLPFLMYLDVSHNKLVTMLDFDAPFNLTYVNYSYNLVIDIGDLSKFWSLVSIDLSHNMIGKIGGFENLKYLRHLNLSYNEIAHIENLKIKSLLTLNLEHNNISEVKDGGLKFLDEIITIKLGFNYLKSLKLFRNVFNVQTIGMEMNDVEDLMELTHLQHLMYLVNLNLNGNYVTQFDNYFEICLSLADHLMYLDGEYVTSSQKAEASLRYNAPPLLKSSKKNSLLFFANQLNHPLITASIVPYDQPSPPILVLVGVIGSKKKEFVKKIGNTFTNYVKIAVSHTTRHRLEDEEEGSTYYYISQEEFNHRIHRGIFLTVAEILGNSYGLAQSELAKATEENYVLLCHTDLTGALTLRAKGLRVYLVLALPSSESIHKQWLLEKYCGVDEGPGIMELRNWPEGVKQQKFDSSEKSKAANIKDVEEILNDIVGTLPVFTKSDSEISEEEEQTVQEEISRDSDNFICLYSNPHVISDKDNTQQPESILKTSNFKIKPSIRDFKKIENEAVSSNGNKTLRTSRSVTFVDSIRADGLEEWEGMSASQALIGASDGSLPEPLSVLSKIYHSTSFNKNAISTVDNQYEESILKNFLDIVMFYRNNYLNFHRTNPGIFFEVINTDKEDESMEKLKNLLRYIVTSQKGQKSKYSYKKDPLYKTMVQNRLDELMKEINNTVFVSQKQQMCYKKKI